MSVARARCDGCLQVLAPLALSPLVRARSLSLSLSLSLALSVPLSHAMDLGRLEARMLTCSLVPSAASLATAAATYVLSCCVLPKEPCKKTCCVRKRTDAPSLPLPSLPLALFLLSLLFLFVSFSFPPSLFLPFSLLTLTVSSSGSTCESLLLGD